MILYIWKGFCSSPSFSNFVPLGIFKSFILFGSVNLFFWEPYFILFYFEGPLHLIFFHWQSMEFFLGLKSNSSIKINELLDEIEVEIGVWCKSQLLISNLKVFHVCGIGKKRQLVDLEICVQNVLMIMWATPSLFKTLTNFNMKMFEKLM